MSATGRFALNYYFFGGTFVILYYYLFKKNHFSRIELFIILLGPYLTSIFFFSIKYGNVVLLPIAFVPFLLLILPSFFKNSFLTGAISVLVISIVSFYFYPDFQKRNLGEKLNIKNNEFVSLKLLDFKNDTFTLKSLKEKIIILDFWYSRCGICFTQFPKFQELKDFYNNDKDILLATVNIPYGKDSLYNPFEKLKMYSFYQLKGLGNTTTNY